jgi:hypothetical protein
MKWLDEMTWWNDLMKWLNEITVDEISSWNDYRQHDLDCWLDKMTVN